jgi:hypothetical protein
MPVWLPSADLHAAEISVEHHLEIELIPGAHMLNGRDAMQIHVDDRHMLVFSLSQRVTQLRVELNGKVRSFRFSNSELEVPLEPDERRRTVAIVIDYEAVFNDPVPVNPLNTDNPGFGVTGSISEAGTFLLSGAGWYPDLVDGRDRFMLKVKAPHGILAVTAGRSLGHSHVGGFTFSDWSVERPMRGLALSAAAYQLREQKIGEVTAATYFLPSNQDLAESYLEAVSKYLKLYADLIGPYPFPKFAVVENFFPTGYGFPSYTLLGSTVLRLPFIISTSLGHEIAHCWWGNGVLVDYEQGNWSEALTTYLSDYLYKELESPAEAKSYRLQTLRNYTALVPAAKDFPLSRFISRVDPVTKAIGYDKGAMVFHMLRRTIGDEAFWGALRDIYRERLFQTVSWDDLRRAFEKRSQQPLDVFFDQWVKRKGAPKIGLEAIRSERLDAGWTVTGRLSQGSPFFSSVFELVLDAENGRLTRVVPLSDASTPFEFALASAPKQLAVDPDHHMLRRLDSVEIPPTVNSLKGSPSTLIVVGANEESKAGRQLADVLVQSLGLKHHNIISEENLNRNRLEGRDVILVGYPSDPSLLRTLPSGLRLDPNGFQVEGGPSSTDSDAFFGVLPHPYDANRVMAVFLHWSARYAEIAAGKVTHYGRYSYLAFEKGRNQGKGTWPVAHSPVFYRWQ